MRAKASTSRALPHKTSRSSSPLSPFPGSSGPLTIVSQSLVFFASSLHAAPRSPVNYATLARVPTKLIKLQLSSSYLHKLLSRLYAASNALLSQRNFRHSLGKGTWHLRVRKEKGKRTRIRRRRCESRKERAKHFVRQWYAARHLSSVCQARPPTTHVEQILRTLSNFAVDF